jgi:cytoskeletal protein RodZ
MDGQDPLKPMSNHPNAVKIDQTPQAQEPQEPFESESDSPTPKPKFEPVGPDYHKNKSKKGLWIIIFVIIVLLAAAVYWFLLKPEPVKAPTKTSSSNQEQSSAAQTSTATTHYDSSSFNLGFDYPKGWKVSDVAGSGKLTVTSPDEQLKGADGQTVSGQIVMTIRDKTQKLTEFDKGNATAVLDSEKIAYTKPTETQRGNTYLSFLGYASSTQTGLDGIYITGDAGYTKDQAVPLVDVSKSDPVISVTFLKDNKQVTISSNSWSNDSFAKPIKTMLQSLAIQ